MESLGFIPPYVITFWGIVITLLTVLVHVVFGFGVYLDALRMYRAGRPPVLVNPGTWLFATVLGGVFVAAVYWALHHSSLNPSVSVAPTETNKEASV